MNITKRQSFFLLLISTLFMLSCKKDGERKEEISIPILWQGIPSIEKTDNGRIFVAWYSGGSGEPAPENTCFFSYSDDNGATFTDRQIIAAPRTTHRAYDPCLWIDPDKQFWYIFNRSSTQTGEHAVYARICENPNAENLVWSNEFLLDFNVPYAFRSTKPAVLSTGEWVFPVTHASEKIFAWFFFGQETQGVAVTTNKGKMWSLYGNVATPSWGLENMIVELNDGRLWMLMRSGVDYLWESFSSDRGKTWSEGKASSISNPVSRFFICRLQSGNLLLVNHYKFIGRSHLTAKISIDDGASWNEGLLLDEREWVSYPDGVQDKDGTIWIVYDRDRQGAGEILLAKFREEDVIAGKNVSDKVSLKQIVNRK
ncbi:MAG: glycoside hydrolase [Bacteroidales bacterium]|jgi:hypothetical protein|nr:glycoside hydrolase [Bacteroidales bacterium]